MKITLETPLRVEANWDREWAYTLTADMTYRVTGVVLPDLEAWDGKRLLLTMFGGVIIIHKGYAFDGMTCYPDNPANLAGACLHDALYQTGAVSRKLADDMLRAVLKSQGQPDRFLVHLGVRMFGWMAWKSNKNITIKKL